MRKLLALLFPIFSAVIALAQPGVVKELAPDIYYYFGDELKHRSANCVWIVLNDYVVVVDANYPWASKEILEEIRKTTDKPVRFVVNTHYHHDHTFGNGVFAEAGATVVSTAAAAEEMKTLGKKEWDQNYSGQPLTGYYRVFPSLTFDKTLAFDDGTRRVELIAMPAAHTGGDAVVVLPKEKILITGDLFVNGNPWGNNVADPHADYDGWITVLDTLSRWKMNIVIPGHGEPATTAHLTRQRAYLAAMVLHVRQGMKAGKSREEIIVSADFSSIPVYGTNKTSTTRSVGALYDALTKKK